MTDHAPQSAFDPAIIPSCPLMACYRTCKRLLRTCKRPAPDEQEGRINRLKILEKYRKRAIGNGEKKREPVLAG